MNLSVVNEIKNINKVTKKNTIILVAYDKAAPSNPHLFVKIDTTLSI